MKSKTMILLAGLLTLGLAAGCKEQKPAQMAAPEKAAAAQPATPAGQAAASGAKTGKVVETIDSGGYTYVQVDTGTEKFWAAAPQIAVKVGDPVAVPPGLLMKDYLSKPLNRTFDAVYFVDNILVGGTQAIAGAPAGAAVKPGEMPQGHPPVTGKTATEVDFSGLKKAAGGKTVSEVFAGKGQLSGKQVVLRAKVVKFSPQIMGKNWLHLQDGTGSDGTNDLTITTDASAKVGDTVMVTGVLATDKDFGYGYKYPVIVENAKVVVE